jgi:CheY-like chemotaxis protein/two-component sensor histidine kinase
VPFNNILGAMLGYVELSQGLLNSGQDNAREKLSRYLGMMMSSGIRAKELIAQMLTFSRLTPENEASQAPVIMLAPVLKEVVSLLRSSIPSSIELNYRWTNENLKARIQAVHLHQILLNLGINARDAIAEYGKIDISLSEHHADNELCSSCNKRYAGDYVSLAVRDSGKGIPGQILSKIFEPFFTTKEVGKGTGMGLSVVHGLVHALGGHIQVQSNAGSGTLVTILLPLESLADAGVQLQYDHSKGLANLKGAKIMVVDDEQAMATMLHEFLSVYGARVDSYTDPKLALEAFRHYAADIDLVITDETMPGLSGLHMAEAMLRIKPDLPVILCTGYSEHANAEISRRAGIAAFLHKPLQMADLLQQVAALLQAGPL